MLWDPPVVQQQYRNTDGQTLTELSEVYVATGSSAEKLTADKDAMDNNGIQIAPSALTAMFCIQEKSLCTYPMKPSPDGPSPSQHQKLCTVCAV